MANKGRVLGCLVALLLVVGVAPKVAAEDFGDSGRFGSGLLGLWSRIVASWSQAFEVSGSDVGALGRAAQGSELGPILEPTGAPGRSELGPILEPTGAPRRSELGPILEPTGPPRRSALGPILEPTGAPRASELGPILEPTGPPRTQTVAGRGGSRLF